MFDDDDIAEEYARVTSLDKYTPRTVFGTGYSIITLFQATGKERGGFRRNGGRWTVHEKEVKKAKILQLLREGCSISRIARTLQASRTTIIEYRNRSLECRQQ